MNSERLIAYFTMEIALEKGMPTYAGGLGILAGDTILTAADMKLPMVAVTLLPRKGYFYQRLDQSGWQSEDPVSWVPGDFLEELAPHVEVTIDTHKVQLRAWQYDVKGPGDHTVPVLFLDADLPANEPWFRSLTDQLYGGDWYYRLCQEIILGIGGLRMLRALDHRAIQRFHLNEGHSSLLGIELLEERRRAVGRQEITDEDVAAVRAQCVFTTHTPVAAGHDKFPMDIATRVIGLSPEFLKREHLLCCDEVFNMTYLALNLSGYVNGVTRKHSEVARLMFAGHEFDAITNGVHPERWTSPALQQLFDKHIPRWRHDPYNLRYALSIPEPEIWQAHLLAKRTLIEHVNRETNAGMDADHLTLGFARRAAPYKRGGLPVSDIERLKQIAHKAGPIQIVYAGKAHPGDDTGKSIIQRIYKAREALTGEVRIAYLVNYDIELAQMLTAGVDVWLNTPIPPMESSGTSGMKAALNGVPSLSILDGWWLEGCIEGVTGWAIDGAPTQGDARDRWESDAASLYAKLESTVAPLFYKNRDNFIGVMKQAIALNGSFFNTRRMLQQYVSKAYFV
jgi:starch phosphorylase